MDERPNILWLTLESVRADHTSVYGYDRETTPFLNTFANGADVSVLQNGISASIWTPASSASMLTGTHLSTHTVGQDGKAERKLPEYIHTLPELLSKSGYNTSLFSTVSWVSSATGLDRGFDHSKYLTIDKSNFFGLDTKAYDSWRVLLRRFIDNPTFRINELKEELNANKNGMLLNQMERWLTDQNEPGPFFSYGHIWSPHHPYDPIHRFRSEFSDEIEVDIEDALSIVDQIYNGVKPTIASGFDLSNDEWDGIKALYDAEIKYADFVAKRIIETAQSVSDRNLIIVITGDHGDLFGEKEIIGHNLVLHDGLISVPMIVSGIDGITDGLDELSQHIDLTYTLASITDTVTDQFEGRDLRSEGREYAISQRGVADFDQYTKHNPEFDISRFFSDPITCVRTSEFKYISDNERNTLYELPDEYVDVSAYYPTVVEELKIVLEQEGIEWTDDHDQSRIDLEEGMRQRLQDLGYLG